MTNSTCTRCGAELSADAAGGLCPRCLMALNFDSRTMPEGETASSIPPLSPEELADRFPQYEILECLGRGGMGVVYKARQKTLDRVVAIKLLAGEWQGDPGFAARFEREAKTLAQMSHPNIVTVHDFGEAGGLFHIVMEYIDGVNLRDLLGEGKMAPEQALAIVPPICEALEYAHGKGIVHRDIKPENLLLDKDGRVKIADFGIASLVGATGEKSGTPPYMAPEQETGNVDRRADIYALGVVLYEMLTGERPTKDVVAPSRKVQVDVKIDEMVLRALEKEPERRYQTAGEFRTVVETVNATPVVKPPAPERTQGMFRRWWWLFLLMIPLGPVLGLAAGATFSYLAPKKFEAHAKILVRAADSSPATSSNLADYYETIRSRENLAAVATKLDLPHRWMINESQSVELLRRIVTVQKSRATNVIGISVRHTHPQDAVDIANSLAVLPVPESVPSVRVSVIDPATRPTAPVSPNVPLVLALGAGGGLLLSPVLAMLCMFALHRLFPWRPDGRGIGTASRSSSALHIVAWIALFFAILSGLVPTLFHWLKPWAAPWLSPEGQGFMLWLTLACALAAIALGAATRRTPMGGRAFIVGGISLTIWVLFFVAGQMSTGSRTARGTEKSATAANPESSELNKPTTNADPAQLAQEAWQLWQAGKPAEARSKFEQAAKSEDANAWNGLGWACFNSGDTEEGAKAFRRALEIQADHPAALNGLGQIHLSRRDYEQAEVFLLKAAERKATAAWFGLARLYLLQGRFDQAEKWAQMLVDAGQADEMAKKMLEAAKQKQMPEGLRMMIEPAAAGDAGGSSKKSPSSPLQREYHLNASRDGATGPDKISEADSWYPWAEFIKQGDVLRMQNDLPGALQNYRRSLAVAEADVARRPDNARWRFNIAESHIRIGDVQAAAGDTEAARASYARSVAILEKFDSEARQVEPSEVARALVPAFVKLGDTQERLGDHTGARETYRRAVATLLPSGNWDDYFARDSSSRAFAKSFDGDELKRLAEKRYDPGDVDRRFRLADLINRAGAERDGRFRYLLDREDLRKEGTLDLALAGYDYSVNGNEKALDYLLRKLAQEHVGADSEVVVVLDFIDEWDRTIKAVKTHFTATDGAGASAKHAFLERRMYLFPRQYLVHLGKAGEGAPIATPQN